MSLDAKDKLTGRRRFLAGASGLLLVALSASACGFKPLYGSGTSTKDRLQSVRIAPLNNREGQMLHNMLRDRINPSGQPDSPEYLLRVSIKEQIQRLGIRRDATASRYNLKIRTRYTLYTADGRTVLFSGESNASSGYSALDLEAQYGTISAERDARERSSKVIANDIAQRLAVYFAAQSPDGA